MNLLQPMEMLGFHCTGEFLLNNVNVMSKFDQTVEQSEKSYSIAELSINKQKMDDALS